MIASTVNTIIGQRLVRKIAPEGAEDIQADKVQIESIKSTIGRLLPQSESDKAKISEEIGYPDLPLATQNAYTLRRGKDTSQTPGGYKGRVGLYEVIDVNTEIESMILARSTSDAIQKKAVEQGTITMREDGYLKAVSGLTTLDEVNRVTVVETT